MNVLHILLLSSLAAVSFANCDMQSVCYALDESGSISATDFALMKNFTIRSARLLASDNPGASFSAAVFDDRTREALAPTSLEPFVEYIKGVRQRGGGTNIYKGLSTCVTQLEGPTNPRLIILVTDGKGSSGDDPRPEIKNKKIGVLAVGAGKGVDKSFLQDTASAPWFFLPTSFEKLPDFHSSILAIACGAAAPKCPRQV